MFRVLTYSEFRAWDLGFGACKGWFRAQGLGYSWFGQLQV